MKEQDKPSSTSTNGNGKKHLKFLAISRVGLIGDLCVQIQKEGHEVKYFIEEEEEKEVSNGLVEKTENWKDWKDWADIIIFDDSDFGSLADSLRKQGKAVIGGTPYTDKLELNRE